MPFDLCHPLLFFFLMHPAPSRIYTLSLHDALPISNAALAAASSFNLSGPTSGCLRWSESKVWMIAAAIIQTLRSEEHTSELQSRGHLVCRLLLEKKKKETQVHHCCETEYTTR